MLKKISTNKKFWIVIAAVILVLAGILIGVIVHNNTKEFGQSNVGTETDTNKDSSDTTDNSADVEDSIYEGSGLEVKEDDSDTAVDRIDASGSWEDTADHNAENNKEDVSDNEPKDDNEQDMSGEDTLDDDMSWGKVH